MMEVGGGGVLIKILMVLAGLMATGERDGNAPPPGLDLPAAVRSENVFYAAVDIRTLREAMDGRIDPARDLGLPAGEMLAGRLRRFEKQWGIPPESMYAVAARTTRIHVVFSTISEHGVPRFAVVLEGDLAGPVRQAVAGVEEAMPGGQEIAVHALTVDGGEEILLVGSGRDAESVIAAVRPGFVIAATEINLVKDLLRGMAAAREGRPRPDALRPVLRAHGVPLPPAQAPVAAWGYLNARLLTQVAYLAEGGREPLNEVAAVDLLADLSALGPAVMRWDGEGLRFDVAMDPRSEVLRLLQPAPEGASLVRAFGPKATLGGAIRLERPGAAYGFFMERLRAIFRMRRDERRLRDLDRSEQMCEQHLGTPAPELAEGIREVAVVTEGRDRMGLIGGGCVLMRFENEETAGRLFDAFVETLRGDNPDLPVGEEQGVRSIDTFAMGAPGLVLYGDTAALGMDKNTCLAALLRARKRDAAPSALARRAAGRSIVFAADLDALLRDLLPAVLGAPGPGAGQEGLPAANPQDAEVRRAMLSLDIRPDGLGLRLDRGPAAVMEIARLAAPVVRKTVAGARHRAQQAQSTNHVRQILVASLMYRADRDALPPDLDALGEYIADPALFVSPITGKRYVYVGAGIDQAFPERIIVHGHPLPDGRRVVGFGDGRVETMGEEAFRERLRAQQEEAAPDATEEKDGEGEVKENMVF